MAYIRSADADHKSYVFFPQTSCAFGYWSNSVWHDADPSAWVHVYAVDASKNVVLNGSPIERIVEADFFGNTEGWISRFEPIDPTAVKGIKVVVDQDGYQASGTGTLTQDADWADPAGGYRLWGAFAGDFSIVNTGGNRYQHMGWELDCGDLSLPNGQLIVTFDCSYSASWDGLGFGMGGYGDNPLGGSGGSGIYWGTGIRQYIAVAGNFASPGRFQISIGWYGDWSTTAVITKIQWKISGGATVDLWSASPNTGLTAYLSGAQICNVCPEE